MAMETHATQILLALGITSLHLAYAASAQPPKFGYSGLIGPRHWGSLSPNFSLCSTGTEQSPIDIVREDAIYDPSMESLERDYVNANATLINNEFNIELRFEKSVGNVSVNGKNYSLQQLHWHSPSEHTFDGVRYPMELHLVHETQEGDITVIAVLYEYGLPDPFLYQLKDSLEKLEYEATQGDEATFVPSGIVKTKALTLCTREYYRYVGSLTAPPCTEKVVWNILGKARQMTPEQAATLKAPLPIDNRNNSRPLQAQNGRIVNVYHGAPVNPKNPTYNN